MNERRISFIFMNIIYKNAFIPSFNHQHSRYFIQSMHEDTTKRQSTLSAISHIMRCSTIHTTRNVFVCFIRQWVLGTSRICYNLFSIYHLMHGITIHTYTKPHACVFERIFQANVNVSHATYTRRAAKKIKAKIKRKKKKSNDAVSYVCDV